VQLGDPAPLPSAHPERATVRKEVKQGAAGVGREKNRTRRRREREGEERK
jgi:hypothetical protein